MSGLPAMGPDMGAILIEDHCFHAISIDNIGSGWLDNALVDFPYLKNCRHLFNRMEYIACVLKILYHFLGRISLARCNQ